MIAAALVDAVGTRHQPIATGSVPRIVCLVPSITELLCDLGLAPVLVGRTGFCIHPAAVVQAIPKVGGTKDINVERVLQLAPTHLIVNIDENPKPVVAHLAQHIPHVIVTHPLAPRDNLDLYRLLGGLFGRSEQAETLCEAWQGADAQCTAAVPQRV
ncbi:MAG: helical backbone metal receptor, partial [Pseudomonadota bacterium]|nr:helical backbone metal receptor [Pseudomonadota bacterium]